MKIKRQELSKKLKHLKSVVPPKNTMDIKGVLLKGSKLIATTTELTVVANLDIENEQEFVIPEKAIEMIDCLKDEIIDISFVSGKVKIKSAKGTSSFNTVDVNDYPAVSIDFETETENTLFSCSGVDLIESMEKVMYAATVLNDSVRGSVYLKGKANTPIDIVCCDGAQLALYRNFTSAKEFEALIPKASVQKALSLSADAQEVIVSIPDKTHIVFQTDEYKVISRLSTGKMLNYAGVFPKNTMFDVEINRKELLEVISRARICCTERTVPLVVTFETEQMIISVNTSISNFCEPVELQTKIDGNHRVGLDPNFVINALKASDEELLTLSYTGDKSPLVLTDGELKQIILPVRL